MVVLGMKTTLSHIYLNIATGPPWDRPNSNRLMTPPIFDALLVITYTFSRYMLKMKNVYLPILFQNQVSPTLKIFIFCLFWTENQ